MNYFFDAINEYDKLDENYHNYLNNINYIFKFIYNFYNAFKILNDSIEIPENLINNLNKENNYYELEAEIFNILNEISEIFKNFKIKINNFCENLNEKIILKLKNNIKEVEDNYNKNLELFKNNIEHLMKNQNILDDNFKYSYLKINSLNINEKDEINEKNKKIFDIKLLNKIELNEMNKLIEINNKKYLTFIEYEKNSKYKCNQFIKEGLKNFNKFLTDFADNFKNILNQNFFIKFKNNEFIEKPIKIYKFEKINNLSFIEKNSKINKDNFKSKSKKFVENIEYLNKEKKEKEEKLINFVNEIFSENKIQIDFISNIFHLINYQEYFNLLGKEETENNLIILFKTTNSFIFMELIQNKLNENNNLYQLNHYENLYYLSLILQKIITIFNDMNEKIISYIINFILNFSKIYYQNDYLYNLIKIQFFKIQNIWLFYTYNDAIENLNNFLRSNNINNVENTNKINKIKNNALEEKILFSIDNYKKFNNAQKVFLEKKAIEYLTTKLKTFLVYSLCDFNIDCDVGIEIISILSNLIQIDDLTRNELKRIFLVYCFKNKNYIKNMNKMINEYKYKMILFSIKYLDLNNIFNILFLNKNYYNKYKSKIIIEILKNEKLSLKKRLEIWKILLNIKSIKEKYNNYKLILNKYKNTDLDTKFSKNIKIIKLDVERTFFKDNIEENRKKTENILELTNYFYNKIGYCQGMNFLVKFLLNITEFDEEEAFYIMCGLLENTEFLNNFTDDLEFYQNYFKIFEKLIEIFFPLIFQRMKQFKIEAYYYCPSWFFTLFTGIFQNFNDIENYPKCLLLIFDNFLLKGYLAIFQVGFCLINYYKKKIIQLNSNKLGEFLTVYLNQCDIFLNQNFNIFKNEFYNCEENITKDLLINIDNILNNKY